MTGETPDNPMTAEALTKLRFFADESPDALEWLLQDCEIVALRAGDVLLRPGQENDTLYIVQSGALNVHLEKNDEPVNQIQVGHCVGEMSILDSTHTSAWVIAAEDSRLMAICAEQVWRLIAGSHVIAMNLLGIMSGWLRNNNAVIQRTRHQKKFFEYHARVDALTGLHNRRWLEENLERFIARVETAGDGMAMLMLDADHFKAYNDAHGHLAGDSALRSMAETINRYVRATDTAARYGGEEFVVLLPGADAEEALGIAERLCDGIRRMRVSSLDGKALPGITASVGVAIWQPQMHAGALLAAADTALYRAKHSGRDRVSLQVG